MYKTDERMTQVDTMLQTWDSYTGFCYKHQFPTTLSEKIKAKLYFMACQTRWSWREQLGCIVENCGQLLDKVAAHPVAVPDVEVIVRVIEGVSMDGMPPFVEMTEFRRLCFSGFPVSHVQRMPLAQILKLYVAAYQPENIWKECWKAVVGVISNQIIQDVERFVSERPFAVGDVMRHVASS